MPVTKSAAKALRRDRRRTQHNLVLKAQTLSVVKTARLQPSPQTLSQAASILDKAARHGLIHKNKAARLKSSLTKNSSAASSKKPATKPAKTKPVKAKPKTSKKA